MEKFLDGVNFHDVPEGCLADMLGFTTPRDACRFAVVSKVFRSAAESDVVWDRFLPSDCEAIVSRSERGEELLAELRSKKQLYVSLVNCPLLVDGATKSFWLDKSSGKKCWMLSARSLNIIWSSTPMYWQWISIRESRFPEVAELNVVCWLEISGTIKTSMLSPQTGYAAYLVYKLDDLAYGFDNLAIEASIDSSVGKTEALVYLEADSEPLQRATAPLSPRLVPIFEPSLRRDGWQEVKIGEFFTHAESEGEIQLSLMEVKEGISKGGLIVEGIEIRPLETSFEE